MINDIAKTKTISNTKSILRSKKFPVQVESGMKYQKIIKNSEYRQMSRKVFLNVVLYFK